jgi:hypothetical protein
VAVTYFFINPVNPNPFADAAPLVELIGITKSP